MFSVGEIIGIAVQIEENGERFYRKGAGEVKDPFLRELLLWLADEEVHHRDYFLRLKSLSKKAAEPWAEQMSGAILQGVIGDHAFCLDEVDCGSIRDETGLIEEAVGLEKDSITFYEILSTFVDDHEVLEQLGRIIHEEKRHVQLLEERHRVLEPNTPAGWQ